MPNKKINALDVRTAVATDLMLVGDPSTGTAYKSTLATLPLVPTSRTLTINGVAFDLSANRAWTLGTVTSVGLTMPSAFGVANSPVTSSGTLAVTALGSASQYIRGDGELATLPTGGSGGSSISYYLNGGTAASVGTYYQMSQTAVIGTNADFTKTGNGLISQFLTDVGDPNRLQIPAGNWNFEMYFSMSSSGGTTGFYVELLKYDGTTFTSIASSTLIPEEITGGTNIDLYLTSLAVPATTLLVTDRLALRVYIVNNSGGRTATLHTQDSHLCQVITNFAGGVSALNGLTANTQYFATGTSGTSFNIVSSGDTHTFNMPPSANIYTADGTLTGNRTVSVAAFDLFFTGEKGTINTKTLGTNAGSDYAGMNMYNSANELVGSFQIGGVNATSSHANNLIFGARKAGGNVYVIDNSATPVHGFYSAGNVGINTGTSMLASAQLQVNSTTRGLLPPRMTATQRAAISSPATGLLVYQTDGTEGLYEKTASAWRIINGAVGMAIGGAITSATAGSVLFAGTSGVLAQNNANFFWDNTNNRLGIGTASPTAKLSITTTGSADNLELDSTGSGVTGLRLATSGLIRGYFATARVAGQYFPDALAGDLIFRAETDKILFGKSGGNATLAIVGNNVTIGTAISAGYKFDVNGTARVSGVLTVASSTNYTGVLVNGNNAPRVIFATGTNTSGITMGLSGLDSTVFTINDVFNFKGGFISMGADMPVTGTIFRMTTSIAGTATAYGINISSIIQSNVTTAANIYSSNTGTPNFAFTLSNLRHFYAQPQTKGAASTITNQSGFFADSNLIDATNNFGFYGNIPSAANRWNLYMAGTADNYLAGDLGIGTTSVTNWLNIGAGTTAKAQINLASSTAPTSPNNGDIWFTGTELKIQVGGVTKTFTLV